MEKVRHVNLTTLIIVALLAIALGVNLSLQRRPKLKRPDFSFGAFRIPSRQSTVQNRLDDAQLKQLTLNKKDEAFLKELQRYHRAEYQAERQRKAGQLPVQRKKVMLVTSQYIAAHSIERYIALGLYARKQLLLALRRFRIEVRHAHSTVLRQLGKNSKAREALVNWGGSFIQFCLRGGLIARRGEVIVNGVKVVRVLHKYQWLILASYATMAERHLTPYERRIFLRWKIESNQANSLQSKLRAVADLRRIDPTYPADLTIGMLYAQRKMWDRAAMYFWRAFAEDPSDFRTIRYLDYVTNPSNF